MTARRLARVTARARLAAAQNARTAPKPACGVCLPAGATSCPALPVEGARLRRGPRVLRHNPERTP